MAGITQTFLNHLSIMQRDVLIKHAEGPQPILIHLVEHRATTRLMTRGLVRGDVSPKPRFSVLTELGREAAAMILGRYADALVASGYLEPEYLRPIDMLQHLQAAARKRPAPDTPALLAAQMAETRAKPAP